MKISQVKLLIEAVNTDVLHNTLEKMDAIYRTESEKEEKIISLIDDYLRRGNNINALDAKTKTGFLHYAVMYGLNGVVKYLIENGIEYPRERPNFTVINLWAGIKGNDMETYELLKPMLTPEDYNPTDGNPSPAMAAAQAFNYDKFKRLIDDGCDVYTKDINGATIFHYLAKNKYSEPSHSEKNDAFNIVDYLLEQGLDINAMDDMGRTALMWCGRTAKWLANYLKDNGATRTSKYRAEHAGEKIQSRKAKNSPVETTPTQQPLSSLPKGLNVGAVWACDRKYYVVTDVRGSYVHLAPIKAPFRNEVDTTPTGREFKSQIIKSPNENISVVRYGKFISPLK